MSPASNTEIISNRSSTHTFFDWSQGSPSIGHRASIILPKAGFMEAYWEKNKYDSQQQSGPRGWWKDTYQYWIHTMFIVMYMHHSIRSLTLDQTPNVLLFLQRTILIWDCAYVRDNQVSPRDTILEIRPTTFSPSALLLSFSHTNPQSKNEF